MISKKNITEESSKEKNTRPDTSSAETIKRGKAAIQARQEVDNRPNELKQKEEKEDAEKWRNEG